MASRFSKPSALRLALRTATEHGYTGARMDPICTAADANARMVYHYFTDELGTEELKLDVFATAPMAGLLTMFDFIFRHFARHPDLIQFLYS